MLRVRVKGTGWTGGPSLNTFHFVTSSEIQANAEACTARVRSAWVKLATFFPTTMSHSVDPQVDIINPVNGDITGTFLCVSGIAVMPGTGADAVLMAPSTALLLKLQTGTYLDGRRLQGRGYISPVRRATADDNGTPNAAAITAITLLGNDLRNSGTDPQLVVWRRPREADATVTPAVTARVGSTGEVTVVGCPDKFAVLRSRRD